MCKTFNNIKGEEKMKLNKELFKGIVIGCTLSLVIAGTIIPTAAASIFRNESIKVTYSGIKLYVDGKLTTPRDAKGDVVEPFIYNGTTYLPARALSNALTNSTKEVTWLPETQTIHIGKAPLAPQVDASQIKPYEGSIRTGLDAEFYLLDKKISPVNNYKYEAVIVLDSKYSKLKGRIATEYTKLGATNGGKIKFFSVDPKGVKSLIASFDHFAGDPIIDFEIPLYGVDILRIEKDSYYHNVFDCVYESMP